MHTVKLVTKVLKNIKFQKLLFIIPEVYNKGVAFWIEQSIFYKILTTVFKG